MNMITITGIVIIFIYTAVIMGIAWKTSRQTNLTNTGKKFFLGSGTKAVSLLLTLASTFSSWVFMGAPASTYVNGHTWIAMAAMYQLTLAMTCGYFGPRFWILRKKFDFVTHADLVVEYYQNHRLRYIMSGAFVIALLTGTIAQFKAIGVSISVMTRGSIPEWGGALYAAIVVGVYLYFGGFHGEVLVEMFQSLIFILILWGGFAIVLFHTGGLGGLFTQVAATDSNLLLYLGVESGWNWKMASSFCLVSILGGIISPGYWQRYYAADSTRTLIKTSVWLPLLTGIGVTLCAGLVGLAANLYHLEITSTDAVYQVLLSTISSPYWSVIVALGITASAMSTTAGNMNVSAMLVSYDFIRILKKENNDQKLRGIGRRCIIILLILGFLLSLRTPTSVTMLIQLSAAFYMTAAYPIIGIFFWKRATAAGCLSGMIGGFATVCITNFIVKNPLDIIAGAWGFGVGMTLFVVVSLLTSPVSESQRDRFFSPLRERRTFPETNVL